MNGTPAVGMEKKAQQPRFTLSLSLSFRTKEREKRPLSEALQHRIFRLFDLPARINRTLRFTARVIDERMKRPCLRRYSRPLRFFLNISFLPRDRVRLSERRVPPAVF